jgi:hypothetical protein
LRSRARALAAPPASAAPHRTATTTMNAWHGLAVALVVLVLAVGNTVAGATADRSCAAAAGAFTAESFGLLVVTHGAFSIALALIQALISLIVGCNDGVPDHECAVLWFRMAGFVNLLLLFLFGAATFSFATTVAGACPASGPWFAYGIFFLVSQALVGAYAWFTAPTTWWMPPPPLPCCGGAASAPTINIKA